MTGTKKKSLHSIALRRRDFLKAGLTAGGLTAAGGLLSVPLTTYTEDKINTSGRPWWVSSPSSLEIWDIRPYPASMMWDPAWLLQ